MSEQRDSSEWKTNIWAPWRMEYIESLGTGEDDCFLCETLAHAEKDDENHVIWRGKRSFAMLNRFPYTGGHSLISPNRHVGELAEVDEPTLLEMFALVRDMQRALAHAIRAQGFNIGINVGRCAGAGLPGHLHVHIVPRWSGDTNFMAVFGDVRVIPTSLSRLRDELRQAGRQLGLPELPQAPAEGGERT